MFAAYAPEPRDVEPPTENVQESKGLLPTATSYPPVIGSEVINTVKPSFVLNESSEVTYQKVLSRKKEHSSDNDKPSKKQKDKKHLKKKKKHSREHSPHNLEIALVKPKSDRSQRSIPIPELAAAHLTLSQNYFLDVKGDKTNLVVCPYQSTLKRYYTVKGVLGDSFGKHKIKKKESLRKSRYFGKSNRKILSATTEDTEDKTLSRGSEESQQLNERLKTNPTDVEAWLKFVESQDIQASDVFESEDEPKSSVKKKHFRALIERKLSIIAKALEHNPKSIELILCKLKLMYQLGSSSTLQQEWQNTLFVHPTSVQLWNDYLTYMERNFEEFSVKRVLKAYSSCLNKLYQIQLPSFKSHTKPKDVEHSMIDVISKLGCFLHSAGWTEVCTSIFQAFAEICFNRSGDLVQNTLETWWNSNCARFGEKTVDGEPSRQVHGCDIGDKEDAILSDKSGEFPGAWYAIEQLRSLEHWQACSGEEDSEDVERYVKFTDILPYLFPIANSEHLHFRLLTGLLQSIGIPLAPASQAQMYWAPVVAENSFVYSLNAEINSALPPVHAPTLTTSASYLGFAREIFVQLWSKLKHPYRLESILWWFAIEKQLVASKKNEKDFSLHWKATKAWIRNFLKKVPPNEIASSVLLYTAFAVIQIEAGEHKDARRVLQTILEHNATNPLQMEPSRVRFNLRVSLLHSWFEFIRAILLEPSEKSQKVAINLLVKLASGLTFNAVLKEVTPALMLKAKRKFEAILDENRAVHQNDYVLFHEPEELTILLGCHSTFLSLIEGSSSAFKYFTGWLNSNKKSLDFNPEHRFDTTFLRYHTLRELAYVNLLCLLNRSRSWVRDYNPKFFHDALSYALDEYPNSWQLLSIIIQSDTIHCNTFSNFWRNLVAKAKSVKTMAEIPTSIAVLAILARWENNLQLNDVGEESNATALSFGRRREHLAEFCIENTLACHVPFVWRFLVHQASKRGDARRCQSLLYRAIKECPWSKELYMDIVRCSPASVEEAASLLSEKELRLRLPVEELRLLLQSEQEEDPMEEEMDSQVPSPAATVI